MVRAALGVLLLTAPCAVAVSRLDNPAWAAAREHKKANENVNLQAYLKKYRHHKNGGAGNSAQQQCHPGEVGGASCDEPAKPARGTAKGGSSGSSSSGDGLTEIHLVGHTHDDVGWQSTTFGYFDQSVQYILSTVTEALAANPARRFIWSEIKWLEMWWPNQTPETQAQFTALVSNGQLEFVGAGWSQSDEVSPSYRDMIDNTMTGHEWLRRTFGTACPNDRCVRNGWQIDMFSGYSATTPQLWAMMGYDGMVVRFAGTDDMRSEWGANKEFEFLWTGGSTLTSNRSEIMTHVIRWNYGDLCYPCGPTQSCDEFVAASKSFAFSSQVIHTQQDVQDYARSLVDWAVGRKVVYQGPLMAVWGADFQFSNATMWFGQMDQVVAEINAHPEVYNAVISYATVATYFARLHDLGLSFPAKADASPFEIGWPHVWQMGSTQNLTTQYQTGAPASRGGYKRRIRDVARNTRAAQFLHASGLATGALGASRGDDFMVAWDANGVAQHHDSVPGTMMSGQASQNCPHVLGLQNNVEECGLCTDPDCLVLEDYVARLEEGRDANTDLLTDAMRQVAGLQTAPSLAVPFAGTLGGATFVVYNPLPHDRAQLVNVSFARPAGATTSPTVLDADGNAVLAQVGVNDTLLAGMFSCTVSCSALYSAPRYEDSAFFVATIPALGFATFTLSFDPAKNSTTTIYPFIAPLGGPNSSITNGKVTAAFSPDTLTLEHVERGGVEVAFKQTYWQYLEPQGGAYCLVEQGPAVKVARPNLATVVKGPVFEQVSQTYAYGKGLVQRYRLVSAQLSDANSEVLEVTHIVGTLPGGRELISRIESDLVTGPRFWSDATGFYELRERALNVTGPISSNYFALVQTAVLQETVDEVTLPSQRRALAVLTSRTMGVASLAAGELEYMLMRRLEQGSDFQGPAPLNDVDGVVDTLWLLAGPAQAVEASRFPRALELEHPLMVFYVSAGEAPLVPRWAPFASQGDWLYADFFVRHSVPAGGGETEYALRLQNLSPAARTVSLESLFPALSFGSCVEMTLTFLQTRAASDASRLTWKADAANSNKVAQAPVSSAGHTAAAAAFGGCADKITLEPLDIRSFALTLA